METPYIVFRGEKHTYERYDGKDFTSVSKLLSRYKEPFNASFWTLYKAIKVVYPQVMKENEQIVKWFRLDEDEGGLIGFLHSQVTVDQSKIDAERANFYKEWDRERDISIDKGNQLHLLKEQASLDRGYEINPFTGKTYPVIARKSSTEDNFTIKRNLFELEDGYYPELLIYYEDENSDIYISGQSDCVFIETIDGVRYVDIDDLKSNKKIDTKGFFKRSGTTKMKYPLSHLECCNHSHYSLQISMYAWMLEQQGFVPRNLAFHHIDVMYPVVYMKTEIESIIGNLKLENLYI